MAYSGVLDDISKCVNLEIPGRVPVFACSEEFDVRMAGRVYSDYNSDPMVMAQCQIESVRRFDYDWAWLQVDDCIEFEVLGVGTKGGGDILPATCGYLSATRATLNGLKMPNPKKDGRMPVLLDAIKRVKDAFGDTVCVTGRTAAPFSSATLLYGMSETLMLLFDNAELVRDTVKYFVEMQTMWGCAQLEAGADAIWLGDCNASGHLISVKDYMDFAFDAVKKCVAAYKAAGGFTFYHASEHDIPHMLAQAATGISALSVGPGADLSAVKREVGPKVCILGNVDPIKTLLYGTPEDVRRESIRVMETGKRGGGYIFNSGEMVPRDVPEANMRAMIAAGREFGRY